MRINSIGLRHFRNYRELDEVFAQGINVFYGNNAQGKTNLLESLYCAALGFSYRTKKEEEIATFGEKNFLIRADFTTLDGDSTLEVRKEGRKEFYLDKVKISPRDYYGTVNIVLFSPEDLALVKGEPALRRRFLNMEISQTNRIYLNLIADYNKVLAQRNSFLKAVEEGEMPDRMMLNVWNEQLAELASGIVSIRIKAIEKLKKTASSIYNDITGGSEELSIAYQVKCDEGFIEDFSAFVNKNDWKDFYLAEIAKRERLDVLRGTTSIGPHRDDLLLKVNDRPLRSYGSQGQQRSGALALKLAEIEIFREMKKEYPVLLLDDVMSELDSTRREQLLHFISNRVQTFITLNDRSLVEELPDCAYYEIRAGRIIK